MSYPGAHARTEIYNALCFPRQQWFRERASVLRYTYTACLVTDCGARTYQCTLSNVTPIFLRMLKCSWAHTLSCLFMHYSFANIGHDDTVWSIVSSNCLHSLRLLTISACSIFVVRYYYYLDNFFRLRTLCIQLMVYFSTYNYTTCFGVISIFAIIRCIK